MSLYPMLEPDDPLYFYYHYEQIRYNNLFLIKRCIQHFPYRDQQSPVCVFLQVPQGMHYCIEPLVLIFLASFLPFMFP